ncbi:transcription initiation factor TFIID complex 60 kDa subunit [Endogone sp. FLAS-F59071]|nr:transcription initiation factor TFIID complex 60 kDa subunit [Endogone sp. FLAS-F59071]|eukprot:RUS13613.1 transcription initiation factor TFIID complex 60 kDa subunit [Endogone sp. FLAS-F59071]
MSAFPKDTIKTISESLGIANLKDDVAAALAQDVEYRIHEIVQIGELVLIGIMFDPQEAIKFMRHSKRSKLTVDDIGNALRVRNVEPLYGFASGEPYRFKRAVSNMHELYYVEDEELDFDAILNKPLPKVPLDVTFTAHWLAIEGVQPAIPQNPTPSDAKADLLSKRIKAPTANGGSTAGGVDGTAGVDVKPLVKHVLSKELQMYFERITEAVLSEEESLQIQAFESLRQDPGLHQLLPYFVQFVAEKVTQSIKNLTVLRAMLYMIQSLLTNPHLFVEPYLHQLMPAILSCLVGRRICENPHDDHWSVRDNAAHLAANICHRYGPAYHTLQPRVTKTLLRAFLDPAKPFTTHYGAIVGLTELGPEVVRVLVMPNVKAYGALLQKEIGQGGGSGGGKAKEAGKCQEALMNALRRLIAEEKKSARDEMEGLDDVDEATAEALREAVGEMFVGQVLDEVRSCRVVRALVDAC